MDYVLLLIGLLGIYLQTAECCEESWVSYGRLRVCYKMFTRPKLEWEDADNYCRRQNATLADLYDYADQMFIKDNLLSGVRGHGVWIGISDDVDEGDWRWVNNSRADIDRFKWSPGNPNNGNVPDIFDFFIGQDCVEISLKSNYRGQLNDYDCTERMAFLCKMKDTSTTTIETTTTTLATSIATESDFSRGSETGVTVPVVVTFSVLCLTILLVIAFLLYRRRNRNRKSESNNYEDAHFTSSANENIYTCLDATSQSTLNKNNACATFHDVSCDQSSVHDYQSVQFSTQSSLYETVNCSIHQSDYIKPPPSRKC